MNDGKTKLIIGVNEGCIEDIRESGKWCCAKCRKGIGCNSVMCSKCRRWVRKRCSGTKGSLWDVASVIHAVCVGTPVAPVKSGMVSV